MKSSIGVLTFPLVQANYQPYCNLIRILSEIADDLFVLFPHDASVKGDLPSNNVFEIIHSNQNSAVLRVISYIKTQIRLSYNIAIHPRHKIWIFYIGDVLLLPLITAKLLKKQTIVILGGHLEEEVNRKGDYLSKLLIPIKWMSLHLFDNIIVYSDRLIYSWNLSSHFKKIKIAREQIIDTDRFRIKKEVQDRQNVVGYVGRLSGEKGIQNFLEAALMVMNFEQNIQFIIIGDGYLKDYVKDYISQNLGENAKYIGWISHADLPDYLNSLKLLIIPSYTEGLPNIMLEAMACGTPVLATPVGSIPDFIEDSVNGFLMKDNNPSTIIDSIVKSLQNPNLKEVSHEASRMVNEKFRYNRVVEYWKYLFLEEL